MWQRKRTRPPSSTCSSTPWHSGQAYGDGTPIASSPAVSRRLFLGDVDLHGDEIGDRRTALLRDRSRRQFDQQRRKAGQTGFVIDRDMPARAFRHRRKQRVGRILDDGHAAELLDRGQAGGAVVEIAGQDDADRRRAVDLRRRSEQRIDRRPEAVFPRPRVARTRPGSTIRCMSGARDVDACRRCNCAGFRTDDGVQRRRRGREYRAARRATPARYA